MPQQPRIRDCAVCGGILAPLRICNHCDISNPAEPDLFERTWTCLACKKQSPLQFTCRNCGTRFLYEEAIVLGETEVATCPSCNAPVQAGIQTCQKCGAELKPRQEVAPHVEAVEHPPKPQPKRHLRRLKGEYDDEDIKEIGRIPGVGVKKAEILCRAGYNDIWKIKRATTVELATISGIGEEIAKSIKSATTLILVLPRRRSKEDVFADERECGKCGLPVPIFSIACPECGSVFEEEDIDENLRRQIDRDNLGAVIEFYGRALTKNAEDPLLWFALSLSLNIAGRVDAARKALDKAKALQPGTTRFESLEKKLEGEKKAVPEKPHEESIQVTPVTIEKAPEMHVKEPEKEPQPEKPLKEPEGILCPACKEQLPRDALICHVCGREIEQVVPQKSVEPETPLVVEVTEETSIEPAEAPAKPVVEPAAEPVAELPAQSKAEPSTEPPAEVGSEQPVEEEQVIGRIEVVTPKKRIEASKVSIPIGRRPLMTGRGMVNGKGRVNGLVNGNGFINGSWMSDVALPRSSDTRRYIAIGAILMTVFLIVNILFQMPVGIRKPIQIDGNFSDWQGVEVFREATISENLDVSLTSYTMLYDTGTLFFGAEVGGTLFNDTQGYDSFYLFLDTDSDNSTGYWCAALGSEYMVSVEGTDGGVFASSLMEFKGQDRMDWNRWVTLATASVAVSGGRMEGAVDTSTLTNFDADQIVARFVMDDQDGNTSASTTMIGVRHSALKIVQKGITQTLPASQTDFLELTFSLIGLPLTLDASDIVISHSPNTEITGLPTQLSLSPRSRVVVRIAIDGSHLATGDVVEASLAHVMADRPVTILGPPARAYVIRPPENTRVDGMFADWATPHQDSDVVNVGDKSQDIEAYDANLTGQNAYFYFSTVSPTLEGVLTPVKKQKSYSPSGAATTSNPLPRLTGESFARAYIDTNQSSSDGFGINGIRAKYMIELNGMFGLILGVKTYHWEGRWVVFLCAAQAAKGIHEVEMSIMLSGIDLSDTAFVMETMNWRGMGDMTVAAATRGEVTPRTRGDHFVVMGTSTLLYAFPTLSSPTIDGNWSATEWQEADSYDTNDIVVYVMQNGTHLFLAVRVKSDTVYNAGDYAEIAFDTNNGDETGPTTWDKKFRATDPDGTPVNEDYNGNGTAWNASYVSPYPWLANGTRDTDSGDYITFEFSIPFQEVWNTSSPSAGQIAGLAIHVHDDNDTGTDYYWGSSDLDDPSTFGAIQIPEFKEVLPLLFLVPAIVVVLRRRSGKNNKPLGH